MSKELRCVMNTVARTAGLSGLKPPSVKMNLRQTLALALLLARNGSFSDSRVRGPVAWDRTIVCFSTVRTGFQLLLRVLFASQMDSAANALHFVLEARSRNSALRAVTWRPPGNMNVA